MVVDAGARAGTGAGTGSTSEDAGTGVGAGAGSSCCWHCVVSRWAQQQHRRTAGETSDGLGGERGAQSWLQIRTARNNWPGSTICPRRQQQLKLVWQAARGSMFFFWFHALPIAVF